MGIELLVQGISLRPKYHAPIISVKALGIKGDGIKGDGGGYSNVNDLRPVCWLNIVLQDPFA